jgi:hypothetical protein
LEKLEPEKLPIWYIAFFSSNSHQLPWPDFNDEDKGGVVGISFGSLVGELTVVESGIS